MDSTRNIKTSLNQPVNKNLAATLISIVAVAFPLYGLYGFDWEIAKLSTLSILVLLLYFLFVAGTIFLALGKKGRNLTSVETDKKIAITYSRIQRKLAPVWWVLGIVCLAWVVYLIWELQ